MNFGRIFNLLNFIILLGIICLFIFISPEFHYYLKVGSMISFALVLIYLWLFEKDLVFSQAKKAKAGFLSFSKLKDSFKISKLKSYRQNKMLSLICIVPFFFIPTNNVGLLILYAALVLLVFCKYLQKNDKKVPSKKIAQILISVLVFIFIWNSLKLFSGISLVNDFLQVLAFFEYHVYVFVIFLAATFFYRLTIDTEGDKNVKSQMPRFGLTWSYYLGLAIIFIAFLGLTFTNLLFISQGEVKWINVRNDPITILRGYDDFTPAVVKKTSARCEAYWNAYTSADFGATFNNPNPNAPLCFLHLPGYLARDSVGLHQYIYISKITIIIHNLLLLCLIFYFSSRVFNKKQALLAVALLALHPLFIAFSRIFNHDSIQGIYAMGFILAFWSGLKYRNRNHIIISGVLFSLSLLTQYKSVYLLPLVLLFPLFYWYLTSDARCVKFFTKNILYFYAAAMAVAVIVMPAVIYVPRFIIDRFFFFSGSNLVVMATTAIFTLFIFAIYRTNEFKKVFEILKKGENYFIRIFILGVLGLFISALMKHEVVFSYALYQKVLPDFATSLWSAVIILFYSLPPIVLFLLGLWLILYFIRPKLDFSFVLVFLFFSSLILLILSAHVTNVQLGSGYHLVDKKYIFILLPMLLFGLSLPANLEKINSKVTIVLFTLITVPLVFINIQIMPFYHNYNNFLLTMGKTTSSGSFGVDTGLVANYLNTNYSNINVYHSEGTLHPLLNNNIGIIGWSMEFWNLENKPNFLVITYNTSHRFSKIFDYYRNNNEPIWKIENENVIQVGIYKFDDSINHDELYSKIQNK